MRYFFDLIDGHPPYIDADGIEFKNLEEAESEARKSLVDMARDALLDGKFTDQAIIIRDENGRHVVTLRVKNEFERTTA